MLYPTVLTKTKLTYSEWQNEMIKTVAAIVAVIALAFTVTACGSGGIDSGTITEKWHNEARVYSDLQCGLDWAGNYTCMPVTRSDPEEWGFNLEDCTSEDKGCQTGSVSV